MSNREGWMGGWQLIGKMGGGGELWWRKTGDGQPWRHTTHDIVDINDTRRTTINNFYDRFLADFNNFIG